MNPEPADSNRPEYGPAPPLPEPGPGPLPLDEVPRPTPERAPPTRREKVAVLVQQVERAVRQYQSLSELMEDLKESGVDPAAVGAERARIRGLLFNGVRARLQRVNALEEEEENAAQ